MLRINFPLSCRKEVFLLESGWYSIEFSAVQAIPTKDTYACTMSIPPYIISSWEFFYTFVY